MQHAEKENMCEEVEEEGEGGGGRPSLTQFNCRSVKHLTR